jgi:site-specific recombinase XerD
LSPREARDRWLNRLRSTKRESTVSAYHYRTKHFVEWCEAEDIDSIRGVSGWEIESYETYRRGKGLKSISLNREMGTLQNFLEYCARIELVGEDLPGKVDRPDVPRNAHISEEILEPDRGERLLEYYRVTPGAYGTRAHALLALTWYTGARRGGIRALDVDHFDYDDQFVAFKHRPEIDLPLKNGPDGERMVALPPHVCDIVETYLREHRHDNYDENRLRPLFTSATGRGSKNAVSAWMRLATQPCLQMECPHGKNRDTCEWVNYSQASKCPSARSPHPVRRGSITWQLNRGVPIEVVAKRVNSSVRVIEEHYDQPTQREELEERRREHIDRLGLDSESDDSNDDEGGDSA